MMKITFNKKGFFKTSLLVAHRLKGEKMCQTN